MGNKHIAKESYINYKTSDKSLDKLQALLELINSNVEEVKIEQDGTEAKKSAKNKGRKNSKKDAHDIPKEVRKRGRPRTKEARHETSRFI